MPKITRRSVKLLYQYETWEGKEEKLKIEINTTEHFHLLDLQKLNFSMNSEWFSGGADILTYQFEEMMATKFKALYQRRKGRDLFDAWMILKRDHPDFHFDMESLLATHTEWDFDAAFEMIMTELVPKLKGEAWKGDGEE